jgi:predicted transcriptional regulator
MPSTTPKQAARRLVDRLGDDASFDEIQYHLYVMEKIEGGLADVEAGRTVSHSEAREHLSRWL